jgi:mono/diheme cytochrome c family protein
MDNRPKRNPHGPKILFIFCLALVCLLVANFIREQRKPWVVPEEFKKLQNPLLATDSNLNSAREVYADECAQCHGDHGKGDGPEAKMHDPLPADLTDASRMSTVTDGEIFYQITQGRRPMPAFKNRLTQDQRWQLVVLVRSLSQPSPAR